MHTPSSTLAAWAGVIVATVAPLCDAHQRFVLECRVLHAAETPVPLRDPDPGKTRRGYIWACLRPDAW